MKRGLSVLLAVVLCCGLVVGCGSGDSSEVKKLKRDNESLKKENEELKKATSKSSDDNTGKKEKRKEKDVQEMKLNAPFEVKTEKGTYRITMQGAALTDWYQKDDGKNAIILKYEVENVDFKTGELVDGRDGCLINWDAFKVSTPDGYLLNMWNSTMSAYGFPKIVEPGFKAKEELPYLVDGTPEYVDVVLYRNTGDIAQIRLKIE